jgi:ubiquinone/menaquinone biosynthesis C-methylase UbiE
MTDFDARAADWDSVPLRTARARAVAEGLQARVPLAPHWTALEYGCGTGLLSFFLQPALAHITLADSSTGMLAVLADKIASRGIQNMTPVRLDLSTDPLPPHRYNLIYSLMTLHHIPDTRPILEALYALLDPKGYLCIADLDQEDGSFHGPEVDVHRGFDRAALAELARQAGFKKIEFTTVFQMPKDVGGTIKEFPIFLMVAEK